MLLDKNLIRDIDGYVNATLLCKKGCKLFSKWYRLNNAKRKIKLLSQKLGIKKTILVQIKKGGNDRNNQGSWVHPLLATNLAQWISDDFSIKVSQWIEEWKSIRKENKEQYNRCLIEIIPSPDIIQKEKDIQLKLQKELGGEIEVKTDVGFIDLLTDTELIEIKIGNNWKHGLGQLCAYGEFYENHKKILYLFDIDYDDKIDKICNKYHIKVCYYK